MMSFLKKMVVLSFVLAFVACGDDRPSKSATMMTSNNTTTDTDISEDSGVSNNHSDDAYCEVEPRSGRVEGTVGIGDEIVPFEMPELFCMVLHRRTWHVSGFQAGFGVYDPQAEHPAEAEPIVRISSDYFGEPLSDANAVAEIRLPGEYLRRVSGHLDLDLSTGRGEFVGQTSHAEFEFSCDPEDDLTGERSLQRLGEPGTAIVTHEGRNLSYVMDDLRCSSPYGRLKLVREDRGGSCDFGNLELLSPTGQPISGVGTYDEFYYSTSDIVVALEDWAIGLNERGSLQIQGENPYRGFVTFQSITRGENRIIEFHCPE